MRNQPVKVGEASTFILGLIELATRHIPKENKEKIFVLSSDVKLRIKYINYIKTKADEACALYERKRP